MVMGDLGPMSRGGDRTGLAGVKRCHSVVAVRSCDCHMRGFVKVKTHDLLATGGAKLTGAMVLEGVPARSWRWGPKSMHGRWQGREATLVGAVTRER